MMKRLSGIAAIAVAAISTSALAAPTFYTDKAAFATATSGYTTTVEGFEGITTPTSGGVGVVDYGWDANYNAHPFSRGGVTINDTTQYSKLSVLDNTYLNGGNQIRSRFGAAAGSVLDADYGSLTITFDTAVNSFGIDLATIARGFSGNSSGTFVLTAAGGSTSYTYSGSYGFGFLGVTSGTAFTSITLAAPTANDDVFDNITLGVAPNAGAVPEPASWAMMLAGFGLVGAGMRRRAIRMVQAI